jgi:hypothetical protein
MRRGVLALLVMTLLPGALGAQEEPRFLGMAICRSVTEGADGLTELRGAHNAVWSGNLPVTEDLEVYTRWTGSGAHRVSVSVRTPSSGGTLAQVTDDIDFGNDPVTFFTHTLAGTKFTTPGRYAVEVELDGQSVAQYALYIDDAADLPARPAFVLSVPAEAGSVDARGDAGVTGIFESFSFPSFPSTDSFSIVTLWFSGSGTFTQYVQIADAGGHVLATSRAAAFTARPGRMQVLTDVFDGVVFDVPGACTATVFLDGARVVSSPLVIGRR